MRETSLYLTDDEAHGLRRLAVREGRSQAELIRVTPLQGGFTILPADGPG